MSDDTRGATQPIVLESPRPTMYYYVVTDNFPTFLGISAGGAR